MVTLAYPIALPDTAREGKGQTVDLAQRLGWLFAGLLPWANRRLADLHREEVYEAAGNWRSPVWKHGDLGAPPDWAPSRAGRCALETVGRVIRSQAQRRRAFEALRAVWDTETESELAAGRSYAVACRAAEVCAGEALTTGSLLGVAEQMKAEYHRRTSAYRTGWESFCGVPSPPPWPSTYVEVQSPPVPNRPLLTYAADDGGTDGQAIRYALTLDGSALAIRLLAPANADLSRWSWCQFRLDLPRRKVGPELPRRRSRAPQSRLLDGSVVITARGLHIHGAPHPAAHRRLPHAGAQVQGGAKTVGEVRHPP